MNNTIDVRRAPVPGEKSKEAAAEPPRSCVLAAEGSQESCCRSVGGERSEEEETFGCRRSFLSQDYLLSSASAKSMFTASQLSSNQPAASGFVPPAWLPPGEGRAVWRRLWFALLWVGRGYAQLGDCRN